MAKGFTLWFSGMAGSGKTELAETVEGNLLERGLDVEFLDDTMLREDFGNELGEAPAGFEELALRAGRLANLLTRNGVPTLIAAHAPLREQRETNRQLIGDFVEVYCKRELSACQESAGDDALFATVFEEPERPEILVEIDEEDPEEAAQKIIHTLTLLGKLDSGESESEYSQDEEEKIKKRLKDLGYI